MFLLLVFFSSTLAENLKCTNDPIRLSAGDKYTIDIRDDDFQLNCNFQFIPDLFVFPYFSLSQELKLTDFVNISSRATPFAAARTLGIGYIYQTIIQNVKPDEQGEDLTYFWIPAPFNITFYLTEEAIGYEYLTITIIATDCTPKNTDTMMVNGDGFTTFIDSEQYNSDKSAVLLKSINDTIQLRALNYPELEWDDANRDRVYIYEGETFLCTVKDFYQQFQSDSNFHIESQENSLFIFFRNAQNERGITFLAATIYTFEGDVFVNPLSQSEGPILIDATANPQVVHYVAPAGTHTIRYATHFTFIGDGNVTFYAGAITEPREELRLSTVREDNASFSAPLEVKGRGRTLTLSSGKVMIDSSLSFQNEFQYVKADQQGILMSGNYPYTSRQQEFDAIKLQGSNNEIYYFSLEIFGKGLKPGDVLSMEISGAGDAVQKNFTRSVETLVNGTGTQLSVRYVLGKKSQGVLVRYKVSEPVKEASYGFHLFVPIFLVFCMLF